MKLLALFAILIYVDFIHGQNWFQGMKKGEGRPEDLPKQCSKPPFIGVCHPLEAAWYYDKNDNSCKLLQRGTCAGGNNLFPTMNRCTKECIPLTPKNSAVCLQRPVIGTCAPVMLAWFYDERSRHCKMFNHTICGGGGNWFLTELKCQATCLPKKKPKAYCSMAPRPGRCFLANRKWYFDEKENLCRVFLNQQCGSNDNAFATKEKCLERCSYNKAASTCVNCEHTHKNELPSTMASSQPSQPIQPVNSNGIPLYRPHNLPPQPSFSKKLPAGAVPTLPGIATPVPAGKMPR
ncbi:carboxypeptidase inhibitor SmCI-like [Dermacentor andersoni]|uniref:carboxypeptidase inhibitor SmCI-like n=1 Tax=Dermacentor andersoni TaxID=34620 RepID=UPI003B3A16C1